MRITNIIIIIASSNIVIVIIIIIFSSSSSSLWQRQANALAFEQRFALDTRQLRPGIFLIASLSGLLAKSTISQPVRRFMTLFYTSLKCPEVHPEAAAAA